MYRAVVLVTVYSCRSVQLHRSSLLGQVIRPQSLQASCMAPIARCQLWVPGFIALLWGQNPALTYHEVREIVFNTVTKVEALTSNHYLHVHIYVFSS